MKGTLSSFLKLWIHVNGTHDVVSRLHDIHRLPRVDG